MAVEEDAIRTPIFDRRHPYIVQPPNVLRPRGCFGQSNDPHHPRAAVARVGVDAVVMPRS